MHLSLSLFFFFSSFLSPKPTMPPREEQDPMLPPGWRKIRDTDSGLAYYWNQATNTTTYEKPTAGGAGGVR